VALDQELVQAQVTAGIRAQDQALAVEPISTMILQNTKKEQRTIKKEAVVQEAEQVQVLAQVAEAVPLEAELQVALVAQVAVPMAQVVLPQVVLQTKTINKVMLIQ
jgi:hypothetical protein